MVGVDRSLCAANEAGLRVGEALRSMGAGTRLEHDSRGLAVSRTSRSPPSDPLHPRWQCCRQVNIHYLLVARTITEW